MAISIHSLRGEGDPGDLTVIDIDPRISIHSLRGEGDPELLALIFKDEISIHSLLGEGDLGYTFAFGSRIWISIHSLRGEGDHQVKLVITVVVYFNPLPPWGGRLKLWFNVSLLFNKFQSTPSVGRETQMLFFMGVRNDISIHSLRGEGDLYSYCPFRNHLLDFNPLPPWGGRPCVVHVKQDSKLDISIHSLRGEGDFCSTKVYICLHRFQSTPSVGRETLHKRCHYFGGNAHFNPLPPWGGRLTALPIDIDSDIDFNPLPPWGGRPLQPLYQSSNDITISIHSLRGEGDFLATIACV